MSLKKTECNNSLPSVVIEVGYSRRYWPTVTKIFFSKCRLSASFRCPYYV